MDLIISELEYEKYSPVLYTDKGQRLVINVRDDVLRLLDQAGAVKLGNILPRNKQCEDVAKEGRCSPLMVGLCVIQRLVELGDLTEVPIDRTLVSKQHRIFSHRYGLQG